MSFIGKYVLNFKYCCFIIPSASLGYYGMSYQGNNYYDVPSVEETDNKAHEWPSCLYLRRITF